MAFLTVNGVTIPVKVDSTKLALEDDGQLERAFNRDMRVNRIATKRRLTGVTTPQTATDADAIRALLRGLGHLWPFDATIYSSKGHTVDYFQASLITINTIVGADKYSKHAKVSAGGSVVWNNLQKLIVGANPTRASVMAWKLKQDQSTGWDHYLITADGRKYKNGVTTAETINWMMLTPSAGSVSLQSHDIDPGAWAASTNYALGDKRRPTADNFFNYEVTTDVGSSAASEPTWPTTVGATVVDGGITWTCLGRRELFIDDMVYFPFNVPAGWVASLHTEHAARAWQPLPRLRVGGDIVAPDTALWFVGEVAETEMLKASLSGSAVKAHQVSFSLIEF